MILALRQRHRYVVVVLAIFLPVVFALGIGLRKSVLPVPGLPAVLAVNSQEFDAVEWEQDNFFANTTIQARLLRERKDYGRFAIQFSNPKDFLKPDLLVYWIAGSPGLAGTLPTNAILLGGFGPLALPLPDEMLQSTGAVALYSLADNEIMETSGPVQLNTLVK